MKEGSEEGGSSCAPKVLPLDLDVLDADREVTRNKMLPTEHNVVADAKGNGLQFSIRTAQEMRALPKKSTVSTSEASEKIYLEFFDVCWRCWRCWRTSASNDNPRTDDRAL